MFCVGVVVRGGLGPILSVCVAFCVCVWRVLGGMTAWVGSGSVWGSCVVAALEFVKWVSRNSAAAAVAAALAAVFMARARSTWYRCAAAFAAWAIEFMASVIVCGVLPSHGSSSPHGSHGSKKQSRLLTHESGSCGSGVGPGAL